MTKIYIYYKHLTYFFITCIVGVVDGILVMKQYNFLWLLGLCLCMSWLTAAGASDNDVGVVVSSLEDLGLDENGKLISHHLVYPAAAFSDDDDVCGSMILDLIKVDGINRAALTGDALGIVFPDYDEESSEATTCEAAFLERGTDRSVLGYPMPYKRWSFSMVADARKMKDSLVGWFYQDCWKIEVCVINYLDRKHPLDLFWIHTETGELQLAQTMTYGERNTRCFVTYIGHEFVLKNHLGETIDGYVNEETGVSLTVEYPLILGFGQPPTQTENVAEDYYDREIERTLRNEWSRHTKPLKTFSTLGFSKGRLPNDVFASMGSFFYNNRHHKMSEEWKGKGVFVNWWETDIFMIQAPWKLKELWQVRLADLVSQWAGMPCEETVMYGMRQYVSGARLLTHVDRLTTHVVSLIVNVAQGGLDQDWPVEVFDHAGRLHEVVMEPGDIVYYESAKNLHSRNRPLIGPNAYYVNLFTHYRPASMDEQWWRDDSVTRGREPLLQHHTGDIDKLCTVPPQVTSVETEHLGYGKVECTDRRLGQNISPSLFVAKDGNDLIQWWRRTTPTRKDDNHTLSNDNNEESDDIPTDARSEL